MEHTGQEIGLKTFREFWNTPGIDTKHLKPELSEGGE
jgi:hypothetical protein